MSITDAWQEEAALMFDVREKTGRSSVFSVKTRDEAEKLLAELNMNASAGQEFVIEDRRPLTHAELRDLQHDAQEWLRRRDDGTYEELHDG